MTKFKSYIVTAPHELGIPFDALEPLYEYDGTERKQEGGKRYVRLLCKHGSPVWVREECIKEK